MKLTPRQQAIVDQRGSNLLVSASAGSGKTEVLARRCLALLTDAAAPCAVNELLVVTFTRAAAAELRGRLSNMLSAAAQEARSPSQRACLRQQRVLLDAAEIGTIDAWCMRLLREFYCEAEVEPGYAVIGPEDAELLRARVLDELMLWVYSSTEPLPTETREWIERHVRPSDAFLRDMLRRLSRFRDHLLAPEAWLGRQLAAFQQPGEKLRAEARDMIAAALGRECAFQAAQLDDVSARLAHAASRDVVARYGAALTDWAERLRDGRQLQAVLCDVHAYEIPKLRGVPEADGELLDEIKKKWLGKRLADAWKYDETLALIEGAPEAARLAGILLRLEAEYQTRIQAAKRRIAGCEFADLLRTALKLLGEARADGSLAPTAVARRLRRRYAHVLVDEYQDTSPLQVAVLRLVTREPPEATNRFMVGDIKQSIYGFREAEPRLFLEQARAFAAGREAGAVHHLPDNFRSHADLLRGLNGLFERLFHPNLGGSAYDADERLNAQRADLPNATLDGAARIELHVIGKPPRRGPAADHDDGEDGGLPLEIYECEALLAARRINDLLERGVQVLERDGQRRPVLRALRRGDIVVLLRSAAVRAGQIARALRQAGVASVAVGRESILDSPEVVDLRNVLALLCNRQQDIPLAAYLRGPFVEMTPAELLEIRRASPGGDFSQAVRAVLSERTTAPLPPVQVVEKLRGAMKQLAGWRAAARDLDPAALLRRIRRDGQLDLFARALPGGAQRAAMIEALEHFTAQAGDGVVGLSAFARRLEGLADQEAAPAITPAVGPDVVRVMTIHAAKGLEFPVVLLLDAGAEFPGQPAALECDEQTGIGLEFFDLPARRQCVTAAHPIAKRLRRARELEEEMRLLYVAATRAREKLIVIGHDDEQAWAGIKQRFAPGKTPALLTRQSAGSMLEWLLMATAAAGMESSLVAVECHAAGDFDRAQFKRTDGAGQAGIESVSRDETWIREARRRITAPIDRRLTQREAVISVSRLKQRHTEEEGDLPRVAGRRLEKLARPSWLDAAESEGQALGTATHRVLQYVDLGALGDGERLRREIERLVGERRLSAEQAVLAPVDDLLWFGASEVGRWLGRLAGSETREATPGGTGQAIVLRETPFIYAAPLGIDDERQIIRGTIDCLVVEDDGLTLLDYKTDQVRRPEELEERTQGYQVQVGAYAQAAERLFDRPVKRALLVFLRARVITEVAPGAGVAALLEAPD